MAYKQKYQQIIQNAAKQPPYYCKKDYIVLNLNSNKITHLIKFILKSGIYTLSTGEYTFNLEIRKNPMTIIYLEVVIF